MHSFNIPPVMSFMGVESIKLSELGMKSLDFTLVSSLKCDSHSY